MGWSSVKVGEEAGTLPSMGDGLIFRGGGADTFLHSMFIKSVK